MDSVMLGKRIRARRKEINVSQADLARTLGLSLAFIGHIERGTRNISINTLVDMCNALCISPYILLQDSLSDSVIDNVVDTSREAVIQEVIQMLSRKK